MRVWILGVVLLVAAAFWAGPFVVRAVDARLNRVDRASSPAPSPEARVMHERLWIADLHCDALLWNRDVLDRAERGHVDLPRLLEGNVALQVFSVVTKVPLFANYRRTPAGTDLVTPLVIAARWPRRGWFDLEERALHQARLLRDAAERSGGRLVVIETADDLERLLARQEGGPVGAVLALEGMHALEGRLAAADELFAAGFRIVGISHMFDNAFGGSTHGWRKIGLTDLGRRTIAHLDSLGVVIDLAHASPRTFDDCIAMASRPVIVSHTGLAGTCPGPRNLTDEQARRVAATGGVIGVGFWRRAVCGRDADAIARTMRYAADLVGVDHVALGSDFDGAVATPFDAGGLVALTDALRRAGFTDAQIEKVMGGNVRRVLLAALPRER